ncbi:MAG: glutaredoxin family protein [Cellvibrionaceae bacterium]|nr:glutaredoxin family protein [Cellvibrionaceae bacterium]
MISLILYSTAGCHLCELAEAQLQDAAQAFELTWTVVDIADSAELMKPYALRIPVVTEPVTGRDIGWPFDQTELREWLTQFSPPSATS